MTPVVADASRPYRCARDHKDVSFLLEIDTAEKQRSILDNFCELLVTAVRKHLFSIRGPTRAKSTHDAGSKKTTMSKRKTLGLDEDEAHQHSTEAQNKVVDQCHRNFGTSVRGRVFLKVLKGLLTRNLQCSNTF